MAVPRLKSYSSENTQDPTPSPFLFSMPQNYLDIENSTQTGLPAKLCFTLWQDM